MSFMVKVNSLQLSSVYMLQFIINDKTFHLLSSSYHGECRSGSGHGYQTCQEVMKMISYDIKITCKIRDGHFKQL